MTVKAGDKLVNQGTITSHPGSGGTRTIEGSLRNRGVLELPAYYTSGDGGRNGELEITGDYKQAPSASLEVVTNGPVTKYSSHWSHLIVGGTARLRGELGFVANYTVPGQRFNILSAGTRVGKFSAVVPGTTYSQLLEAVYNEDGVDLLNPGG